jgi:ABC-type antimicrobial peptide transport system permease subunit
VVVVSRSFAASTWPGGNPLGRQVIFDEAEITATVIGVVGDVRHRDLTDADARTIYASHDQNPGLFNTLVVRTSVPPLGVADAVRHAVWEVDADQPVWKIRSLDALVARWLSARQFLLQLVMFFGLSAAALSVVGLYGVVAANVSQRTREMGIRVALGATRGALLRLVLWQGARIGALGIGGGLAAALLFAQGLQGFLYGIDARDPLTFAATGAILLLAALAASLGPARRATRVDAALLLRQ